MMGGLIHDEFHVLVKGRQDIGTACVVHMFVAAHFAAAAAARRMLNRL